MTEKVRPEWIVQVYYGQRYGWEDVYTGEDKRDARARLKEYRVNEPQYSHRLIMRRPKWYVGYVPLLNGTTRLVAFQAHDTPTFGSHGEKYAAVIGPFKTKRAALWMVKYGKGNPHATHVDAVERLAKLDKEGRL